MSHTPGPWKKWEATDPDIGEPTAHVALVNDTFIVGSGLLGNPEDDAALIIAAPKMYEALKLAETELVGRGCPLYEGPVAVIREALAAAEAQS